MRYKDFLQWVLLVLFTSTIIQGCDKEPRICKGKLTNEYDNPYFDCDYLCNSELSPKERLNLHYIDIMVGQVHADHKDPCIERCRRANCDLKHDSIGHAADDGWGNYRGSIIIIKEETDESNMNSFEKANKEQPQIIEQKHAEKSYKEQQHLAECKKECENTYGDHTAIHQCELRGRECTTAMTRSQCENLKRTYKECRGTYEREFKHCIRMCELN